CNDAEADRNHRVEESNWQRVEFSKSLDMAIERIRAAEVERDRLQSVCVDRGRALSDAMEALRQNERKAEAKYQRSEASEQAWKERYKETSEKLRLLREEFE